MEGVPLHDQLQLPPGHIEFLCHKAGKQGVDSLTWQGWLAWSQEGVRQLWPSGSPEEEVRAPGHSLRCPLVLCAPILIVNEKWSSHGLWRARMRLRHLRDKGLSGSHHQGGCWDQQKSWLRAWATRREMWPLDVAMRSARVCLISSWKCPQGKRPPEFQRICFQNLQVGLSGTKLDHWSCCDEQPRCPFRAKGLIPSAATSATSWEPPSASPWW